MQVNVLEAKNNLSRLIRSAQAGHEVVIAHRGVPVVRLVPTAPGTDATQRLPARTGQALLDWLRAQPLPQRLQRDAHAIDQAIAEERAAWD
jgi:prevent-host-death family protein